VASRVDSRTRARLATVGGVAVATVVVDQVTKWWAQRALASSPRVYGPVHLTLTRNQGAAFGLGAGFAPVVVVGAILVVVATIVLGRATARPVVAVATGLLLGGAVGNLADRLLRSPGWLRGAVVDFIDLRAWPVFNVADSAITVGCVLLVLFAARPHTR
jgi:signal peptidase II